MHHRSVFRDAPQFVSEALSEALGTRVLIKVETANPIRSFKGRGADYLVSHLKREARVVTVSAGNLGQAMANAVPAIRLIEERAVMLLAPALQVLSPIAHRVAIPFESLQHPLAVYDELLTEFARISSTIASWHCASSSSSTGSAPNGQLWRRTRPTTKRASPTSWKRC